MRAPECAIHALEGAIRAPRSAIARQSALFPSGVPNPQWQGAMWALECSIQRSQCTIGASEVRNLCFATPNLHTAE
jgi:hypothetical protein